jgi:GDP/UDP-N,N'-diacetylbacillosamine 2-epimerase (hydrolysing)
MTRKICVITGTRAEYGLLRWVMQGLKDDSDLTLQIVVTGMHLSPEFGLTYREIEQDGFKVDHKVEMLVSSDTSVGIAKSMGLGMIGFADTLNKLKPDLILVLGDRFEIFAAVSAALVACIPIAHLHGGESTQGAFDEAFRHSITKMSHLHFVAAEEYRQRVIQLGEQPDRVFLVGGLGIDNIKRLKLLEREELEESLGIEFGQKNLLVTFHPATLELSNAKEQMDELLAALIELKNTKLIFTYPNADTEGRALIDLINQFVKQNSNAHSFSSLGQLRYLSCVSLVDGVIGNSSSSLLEAPSFKKGSINIGDRQKGRIKADSVIDCAPNKNSISEAINQLYSLDFQSTIKDVKNPYGEGGASELILKLLREHSLEFILKKSFYDVQQ